MCPAKFTFSKISVRDLKEKVRAMKILTDADPSQEIEIWANGIFVDAKTGESIFALSSSLKIEGLLYKSVVAKVDGARCEMRLDKNEEYSFTLSVGL